MAFLKSLNVKTFKFDEDKISISVLGLGRTAPVFSLYGTGRVDDVELVRVEGTEEKLASLVAIFERTAK